MSFSTSDVNALLFTAGMAAFFLLVVLILKAVA